MQSELEILRIRLLGLMASRGWSQTDVSRLCRVGQPQISRLLSGRARRISNRMAIVRDFVDEQIGPLAPDADQRLMAAMSRLWDGTSDGAQKLAALLEAAANVSHGSDATDRERR